MSKKLARPFEMLTLSMVTVRSVSALHREPIDQHLAALVSRLQIRLSRKQLAELNYIPSLKSVILWPPSPPLLRTYQSDEQTAISRAKPLFFAEMFGWPPNTPRPVYMIQHSCWELIHPRLLRPVECYGEGNSSSDSSAHCAIPQLAE